MFSLTGKTKIYGIIGDPIDHSLSPLMQNYALQQCQIDAVYVPFRVTPADLSNAVEGLRSLNVAGFNVTVPHKEKILPLLDKIDPAAQLIGAVNTVVNKNGELIGYNTDASGFLRAAQDELSFSPQGSNVLMLGAGGACRAAVVALATAGVKLITVANRHKDRAENLLEPLAEHFPAVEMKATSYDGSVYLESLSQANLIVHTTSIGLKGEKINFLPLECIKGSALIFDMIYSLSEAPLIKELRSLNLSATNGLGMLAAQGERAFSLWTGVNLEPGFMKQYLLECRTKIE